MDVSLGFMHAPERKRNMWLRIDTRGLAFFRHALWMPQLAVFAGLHPADVQCLCPRQYGRCAKNGPVHPKLGRNLPRTQRQSPQSHIDPLETAIRGQNISFFGTQSSIEPDDPSLSGKRLTEASSICWIIRWHQHAAVKMSCASIV